MEIKELRKLTNLSQGKFAEAYGIPVRTIQQWEQGISSPPNYVYRLLEKEIRRHPITGCNDYISEYRLHYKDSWKQCIPNPFQNCTHIHPLQQAKVRAIIDAVSQDEGVNKIIIFGSSVTYQCHIGSDVDLFVDMKSDYNPITCAFPFQVDFWNNFRVDARLMEEIRSKGVVVYG